MRIQLLNQQHYQTDVVIIGAGIAGIVATIELLQKGKRVILLDKASKDKLGGLAPSAFGGMALAGTPLQKKHNIQDSAALMLKDWHSFADFSDCDEQPKQWAKYYCENALEEVYHWLLGMGIKFMPAVNWVERGLYTPGNSVPRYHIIWGTAHYLMQVLLAKLSSYEPELLTILPQHDVNSLDSANGKIIGCSGSHNKRDFAISAAATIIATGGITGNIEKIKQNWPQSWGAPPKRILNGTHPHADGKMHQIAQAHGAKLSHLDKMWNYAAGIPHPNPSFDNHGLSLIPCKSALWLDSSGKRIGPEPLVTGFDTNYLCQRTTAQKAGYTWQLLNMRIARKEFAISGSEHNNAIRERKMLAFIKTILFGNRQLIAQLEQESDHFIVADNLQQLVAKMNQLTKDDSVKLDNVNAAVAAFNANFERPASQYNDDQIRRIIHARAWKADKLRTCKPAPMTKGLPYIAIKLNLVSRKSLGGIVTNLNSQVLNQEQNAIDGLYAIGECAGFGGGGANGARSLEGTFLSGCILTAKAAAKAVVEHN